MLVSVFWPRMHECFYLFFSLIFSPGSWFFPDYYSPVLNINFNVSCIFYFTQISQIFAENKLPYFLVTN